MREPSLRPERSASANSATSAIVWRTEFYPKGRFCQPEDGSWLWLSQVALMTACSGFFASNYVNYTKIGFIRVHSMPLLLTLRKPYEVGACKPCQQRSRKSPGFRAKTGDFAARVDDSLCVRTGKFAMSIRDRAFFTAETQRIRRKPKNLCEISVSAVNFLNWAA